MKPYKVTPTRPAHHVWMLVATREPHRQQREDVPGDLERAIPSVPSRESGKMPHAAMSREPASEVLPEPGRVLALASGAALFAPLTGRRRNLR